MYDFFFLVTELVRDILFTHLCNSFGDHLYVFFHVQFFWWEGQKNNHIRDCTSMKCMTTIDS